jgi:hypothetical protein
MSTWNAENLLKAIAEASTKECITEARMAEITGMEPVQIERAALKLRKHDLLTKTARGCHKLTDAGRAAAAEGKQLRSGPNGQHSGPKVNKDSLRIRAWRAMKLKQKFSIPDLCMLCAQGEEKDIVSNLRKYVTALEKAGYLTRLNRREPGQALTSNGHIRWWLMPEKITGLAAPVWSQSNNSVYDPNTESTILLEEMRHVA